MDKPIIVYEDDFLIVINKPAGWVVNDAITVGANPVVQNWIKENFNFPISLSVEERSGIVHRLDKDTSGILLIAKTKEVFGLLQTEFKERKVKKTYIALAHGVGPDQGSVVASVGRLPWNRERFGVLPGGRDAETQFKRIEVYTPKDGEEKYSLLEIYPKTGRTHQIRIHLKHMGHPIVSDSFYAGRKTARADKLWCPRLFLHASKICFTHPASKKEVKFSVPLAEDLGEALKCLKILTS